MVTYIYFVKCPNCEDEHFDFFDEAKEYALGCLSKKPVITQTEVCRNDFGECTDHCDLGTVWSWEDMMKDTEPEDMVFSKAETFGISEDKVVEDSIEPVEEAISKVQADYLSRRKPMTKEEFAERLETEDEILIFTGDPREMGIRGRDYFAAKVDGKYEVTYWDETYNDDFTDSELAETFDTIDELWAYMVNFMEDDDFNPEYNYLAEGCAKKPIPEGITIEQLVEEMEENEDTVECAGCEELFPKDECFHKEDIGWLCGDCEDRIVKCTWCDELYDKSECRYEVDLGWLCDRCEAAIKSRGETLTFREGNYWDFLDEDLKDTLTEALGFDCPKLKEADTNKPGFAKYRIISIFRKDPSVQGTYGDCPYLDGSNSLTTQFKGVTLVDGTRHSYGTLRDIMLADNGEVMITTVEGKIYSLRQALKIASPVTDKISNTRTVLLALKAAAEAAEKSLGTKQVRNLRVRNALEKLDKKVANEFKAAITNIIFRIPPHNAYSADDILDIDPDASEAIAEKAAEKINKIHDDFYGLPFVRSNKDQMESSGMIAERVPAEKAAWILSSWGAVGKVYFDRPINKLSAEAQNIITNAKLSDAKVDPNADSVDCYRLATELIRHFGDDPWFFTKADTSDTIAGDALTEGLVDANDLGGFAHINDALGWLVKHVNKIRDKYGKGPSFVTKAFPELAKSNETGMTDTSKYSPGAKYVYTTSIPVAVYTGMRELEESLKFDVSRFEDEVKPRLFKKAANDFLSDAIDKAFSSIELTYNIKKLDDFAIHATYSGTPYEITFTLTVVLSDKLGKNDVNYKPQRREELEIDSDDDNAFDLDFPEV